MLLNFRGDVGPRKAAPMDVWVLIHPGFKQVLIVDSFFILVSWRSCWLHFNIVHLLTSSSLRSIYITGITDSSCGVTSASQNMFSTIEFQWSMIMTMWLMVMIFSSVSHDVMNATILCRTHTRASSTASSGSLVFSAKNSWWSIFLWTCQSSHLDGNHHKVQEPGTW